MGQTCGQACCDCSQVGGCEACAGMDLAGDAAIIVLVLIVIMAIVGVFVVVYLGSKLVNEVVRTHISVLQKRGLAKDYIVADLEEDSKYIHIHIHVHTYIHTYIHTPILTLFLQFLYILSSVFSCIMCM